MQNINARRIAIPILIPMIPLTKISYALYKKTFIQTEKKMSLFTNRICELALNGVSKKEWKTGFLDK